MTEADLPTFGPGDVFLVHNIDGEAWVYSVARFGSLIGTRRADLDLYPDEEDQ